MVRIFLILMLSQFALHSLAQCDLSVSDNKRFLVHKKDGRVFFWMGDTAWELFHRLSREEAEKYLSKRAEQGFNVVQAVALAELDGLNTPNYYNERPLVDNNPATPNNTYFEHVDWIIKKAAEHNIYIALLPTWGDKVFKDKWGTGPEIFNESNAKAFGKWIGERYKNYTNIIWVMGGDRNPRNDTDINIWRLMAQGIQEGTGGSLNALITFHPQPNSVEEAGSARWFHNDAWLDFNMFQTGHCRENNIWQRIKIAYDKQPTKPVLDGETIYEDHPVCFNAKDLGTSSAYDVRKHAYLSVFAGSFGHTYGCHDVWQMYAPGRTAVNGPHFYWYDALDLPAASQMKYLRKLMESRPMSDRIPDASLVTDLLHEHDRVQPARGKDYAFIYSSQGKEMNIVLGKITGETIIATWYNPRNGEIKDAGTFKNKGQQKIKPPSTGYGQDWVLILDDAAKNYKKPG
ncbi:MAG TPA: glycoside hydrolase family 140 protein [Chitinophagaceae bacterium]|nr:glycoside hydrolase family 140 protein [Chitinophagaceae bacterium]